MDQRFWDQLADAIAEKVLDRLRDGGLGWFDQSASPLGSRRHIATVRRRVSSGKSGAVIIDRRHLLSREALSEELEGYGRKSTAQHEDDELRRELRLVGGDK